MTRSKSKNTKFTIKKILGSRAAL